MMFLVLYLVGAALLAAPFGVLSIDILRLDDMPSYAVDGTDYAFAALLTLVMMVVWPLALIVAVMAIFIRRAVERK